MIRVQWAILILLAPLGSCWWWDAEENRGDRDRSGQHSQHSQQVTVTTTKTQFERRPSTVVKTTTITQSQSLDVSTVLVPSPTTTTILKITESILTVHDASTTTTTEFKIPVLSLITVTIYESCTANISTGFYPNATAYVTSTVSLTVPSPASTQILTQFISQGCPAVPSASISTLIITETPLIFTQPISHTCPAAPTARTTTLTLSGIPSTQILTQRITQTCPAGSTANPETITTSASPSTGVMNNNLAGSYSALVTGSATISARSIATPLRTYGGWNYTGCAQDVYFAGGLDFWNATDTETYTSITDCLNYCQASPVGPSAGFPNAVLRTWIGEPEKFCQCGTAISPIYVSDSICDAPCPDNPAESCGGGIAKVPGDDWGLYMYYAVYQYA